VNPVVVVQRVLGAVLGVALFVAAFVFASVLFAVLAVAALLLWGWLWWRSRNLPKAPRGGAVIEGEYRVESERPLRDDESR
jgi:uncharacterized membrane protein